MWYGVHWIHRMRDLYMLNPVSRDGTVPEIVDGILYHPLLFVSQRCGTEGGSHDVAVWCSRLVISGPAGDWRLRPSNRLWKTIERGGLYTGLCSQNPTLVNLILLSLSGVLVEGSPRKDLAYMLPHDLRPSWACDRLLMINFFVSKLANRFCTFLS